MIMICLCGPRPTTIVTGVALAFDLLVDGLESRNFGVRVVDAVRGGSVSKSGTFTIRRAQDYRLRYPSGLLAFAELLSTHYPWLPSWVAANSCVSATDCVPVIAEPHELNSFLYVGRLVEAKNVQLLLDGFIQAREQSLISDSLRLVFVGDGAERLVLEARAKEAGVSDVVDFKGHVSDVEILRCYYQTAICSVSPGYVGLSATQSFSFGVPMLIADDEFHSPEIEACKEGFNAMYFSSNDTNSLAHKLGQIVNLKSEFLVRREAVAAWTQSNYSFEVMRDVFVNAMDSVLGK